MASGKFCSITQGAQPGALWWSWEVGVGGRFKRKGIYTYIYIYIHTLYIYIYIYTHTNLWLIHNVIWQKPTQHCKTIILLLNINSKKKNAFKYHSQNEIWHFMLSLIEFLPSQIKPHGQNSFPICKDRELTRKLSSSKQCHSMPRSQAIKRPEHS